MSTNAVTLKELSTFGQIVGIYIGKDWEFIVTYRNPFAIDSDRKKELFAIDSDETVNRYHGPIHDFTEFDSLGIDRCGTGYDRLYTEDSFFELVSIPGDFVHRETPVKGIYHIDKTHYDPDTEVTDIYSFLVYSSDIDEFIIRHKEHTSSKGVNW